MPSDVPSSSSSQQPRAAGLETALLTEAGVRWFQGHGLSLVAGSWLLARLWALWGLQPTSDVLTYFETAGRMLDGSSPYSDLASHDSPGALLLLLLPRLAASSPVSYGYVLASLLLVADLAILGMLWRIPGTIFGRAVTWDSARRYETVTMSLTYIALTATVGSLAFHRLDLLVGAILLVLFYGVLQRWRWVWIDILLAIGVWIQPNVLVLVPLIWTHGLVAERKAGTRATHIPLWLDFARYGARRALLLFLALGAMFAPFAMLYGRDMLTSLASRGESGLAIGNAASSVFLVLTKAFSLDPFVIRSAGDSQLHGPLANAAAEFIRMLAPILAVGMAVRFAMWMSREDEAAQRNLILLRGLLATTFALLVTSTVFSSSSLLLIAGLSSLLGSDLRHDIGYLGLRVLILSIVTAVLHEYFYAHLLQQDLVPVVAVFARNALAIWLTISLSIDFSKRVGYQLRFAAPFSRLLTLFRLSLPQVSAALLLAWTATLCFTPENNNNDVWLHFRVGYDVLHTRGFPRVDSYSAVAGGRPFIAHEWLSAVIFYLLHKVGSEAVLPVLNSLVAGTVAALLWFSLRKEDRALVFSAPLLAVTGYCMTSQIQARPHLFTLLFVALWTFVFERWRTSRRWTTLALLPFVQLVWANLHGGYLLGLVLIGLVTAGAATTVLLRNWAPEERFTAKETCQLGATAAACALACLANPYGWRLLLFSYEMATGNDYIKKEIREWLSPFASGNDAFYAYPLAAALAVVLWAGILIRRKALPVIDIAVAALATYMASTAVRFLPFVGLLGYVIAIRHWGAILRTGTKPLLLEHRGAVEFVAFIFLLAATVAYGTPVTPEFRRELGWGRDLTVCHEEVEFMKRAGLSGVIYNEYEDGALIIYSLSPRLKPVVDSRIDIYGEQLFSEYTGS
ncbi:MAG: hypothetical protein MUF54_12185, partial [Polyangiaceae bacterium]|nr:hypothetical protein [Polyangiaceae bacterium]